MQKGGWKASKTRRPTDQERGPNKRGEGGQSKSRVRSVVEVELVVVVVG